MLASWDRLKGWIEEEKEAIILKNWLAGETNRWQKIRLEDESKGREELLKGSRLEQVVEFRNKDAFKNVGGLRAEENEFIDVSVAETEHLEKERKMKSLLLRGGFVIVSVLLVLAGYQWSVAVAAKNDAEKAKEKANNRLENACGVLYRIGAQYDERLQEIWGVTDKGYSRIEKISDQDQNKLCESIIDIDEKYLNPNRARPSWGPGSRDYKWD